VWVANKVSSTGESVLRREGGQQWNAVVSALMHSCGHCLSKLAMLVLLLLMLLPQATG